MVPDAVLPKVTLNQRAKSEYPFAFGEARTVARIVAVNAAT
jgi:hypothetical protein